jgi:endonuclease YncB( thermonuclease family)
VPQSKEKPLVRREISGSARAQTGDTLRIEQSSFRLWGVAAPKMNEFGGYTAMQGLAGLVLGRTVVCEPTGTFLRAQPLARCRTGDRDLGAEVVARGYARDCPTVSAGTYAELERRAVIDVAGGFKLPEECSSIY